MKYLTAGYKEFITVTQRDQRYGIYNTYSFFKRHKQCEKSLQEMFFWQIWAYFRKLLKRARYCLKTILMLMKMIATVSADRLD